MSSKLGLTTGQASFGLPRVLILNSEEKIYSILPGGYTIVSNVFLIFYTRNVWLI